MSFPFARSHRRPPSAASRRARRGRALRAVPEGLERRTLLSTVPSNAWVAEFGHAGNDRITGVAGDGAGSLYVVGDTDYGLSGQGTAGGYDGFVRKMDAATGTAAWERLVGSTGDDRVLAVAAGAAGVFVGGSAQGALPGQTHAGSVDAFVRKYDAQGNVAWTRQFGSSFNESVTALALDDTGVYAVGYTDVNLAGGLGGTDAFLRKYDFNGNTLWTRQFGSSATDVAYGVAVLNSGVYVAGRTRGALPGQSSAGDQDAFVAKFDAGDGTPSWTRQFGSTNWDEPKGIAVDSTGIYVVGQAAAALPGATAIGSFDSFVRKYDHAGNVVWTDQFGTASTDQSMGVAADNSGVYVVGTAFGNLPGQTSPGNNDAYVRRYDYAGNPDWLDQFGTAGADTGAAVAIDATGIYVAGVARGSLSGQHYYNLDDGYVRKLQKSDPGTPLPSSAVDDHYDHAQDATLSVPVAQGLLKNDFFDPKGGAGTAEVVSQPGHGQLSLNADGSFSYTPAAGFIGADSFTYRARQGSTIGTTATVTIAVDAATPPFDWFRSFGGQRPSGLGGGPSSDTARAIAADADGNTYAVGYTNGALPGQTYLGEYGDAWLRKYDADGNVAWTRQIGTNDSDQANAVAVDASGNIYVAGSSFGTFADAIDTSVPSGPNSDVFVRKYSPTGAVLWTRQFGNISSDDALALAVDDAGNVYVGGSVTYNLPGQTAIGGLDAYVVKYDPAGNTQWTKQFGTTVGDAVLGLAVRGAALYAFGETGGVMAGSASLGSTDVFVVRLGMADGATLWTRQVGTSGFDRAYSAAADDSGVYVAGSLNTATAALPGQQAVGGGDAYVLRLNADGTDGWARQFGSSAFDQAFGVAADGGGVYVTGVTSGAFPKETSLGGVDAFVSKFGLDGTPVWTNQFGSSAEDRALGIALAGSHLFVAGYSAGSLPTQTNTTGLYDAFVARLTLAAAPTNAAPVLETNDGLFVASPGSTVPITAAELKATDADTTAAGLSYTLTAAPTRGTLTKLVPAASDGQDNNGDGTVDEAGELAALALGVGGTFTQEDIDSGRLSYVHGGSAQATDGFTFTISDGSTNPSPATTFVIVVNRPPTADAGEAITLREGADLVLNGLASSDPDGAFGDSIVSYLWTIDGVALNPREEAGPLATIPWSTLESIGLSARGSYTVGLTVEDSYGLTGTATTTLKIVNAPPTASITGPTTGVAGQALTFNVSATDVSADDRTAGFSYWFDWDGDAHYDYVYPGRVVGPITVSHAYANPGTYAATVWAVDQSGLDSDPAVIQVVITALTPAAAQSSIEQAVAALPAGGSGSVSYQVGSDQQVLDVIAAVNALAPPADGKQVEVVLNLGAGTYDGQTVSPPAGVTLVINGSGGGQVVFQGHSPALEVTSGRVSLIGVKFVNATDAPTILVGGGSVTLRDCIIEESTASDQAAVRITGGTVDLGTETDPGGNVINVNGPGELVHRTSATPVSAVGSSFTTAGKPLEPFKLSGSVFADFNNNGEVDLGEPGIAGVAITLEGTDFLGNPVHLSKATDADGIYVFQELRPGRYTITEAQPGGYTQGINAVGTAGGTVALDQFDLYLASSLNELPEPNAQNYNFGERPPTTGAVARGQTAGIGFWNNKNGQALIKALDGGVGTRLGDWLAASFPNMFGDLAGASNADVAAAFQSRFVLKGEKLDAQVLATALAVYVTSASLNRTGVGAAYGFLISDYGLGTATYDVGANGEAFGVPNGTPMAIMDLLLAVDARSDGGVLYNGDPLRRSKANNVFGAINQAGRI